MKLRNTLATLLVISVFTPVGAANPFDSVDDLATTNGFVLDKVDVQPAGIHEIPQLSTPPTTHRYYIRDSDGTRLALTVETYPSEGAALVGHETWKATISDVSKKSFSPSISGLPLGQANRLLVTWRENPNSKYATIIRLGYGRYALTLQMTPTPYNGEGGVVLETSNPEEDAKLLESLARITLGELVYKDYAYKSSLQRVSEFAENKRAHYTLNQNSGVSSATMSDKEIIFPIGADQVKVDGTWVEIDGIVGFDGTDAVLPKSVLDKLLD